MLYNTKHRGLLFLSVPLILNDFRALKCQNKGAPTVIVFLGLRELKTSVVPMRGGMRVVVKMFSIFSMSHNKGANL